MLTTTLTQNPPLYPTEDKNQKISEKIGNDDYLRLTSEFSKMTGNIDYCEISCNSYLSYSESKINSISRSELLRMIEKLGLDLKFYCGSEYQSKKSLVGWAIKAQKRLSHFFNFHK